MHRKKPRPAKKSTIQINTGLIKPVGTGDQRLVDSTIVLSAEHLEVIFYLAQIFTLRIS